MTSLTKKTKPNCFFHCRRKDLPNLPRV